MEVGSIVRSKSGHDKGSYYIVVRLEDGYAWIADGRRRRLEKPKRKNPNHLDETRKTVSMESLQTDKKIRHSLWDLNFGPAQIVTEEEET